MSEPQAFDRSRYSTGQAHREPGWPFYSDYGAEHRSHEQGEAAATSGFPILPGRQYGFLTDTSICIGCKACEVACKQWNNLPADDMEWLGTSYDNTHSLGHNTWRHVSFIEQPPIADCGLRIADWETGHPNPQSAIRNPQSASPRWLMQSDICKHCDCAGCLEACPTGAIVRTEFGSVLIQQDICNGCQYCVPSCPFGVITVGVEQDGKAHKCTFCYDRLQDGFEPACAKACPTDSIQFGPVDELRARAERRQAALHGNGFTDARLYGAPDGEGATHGVEGLRSFFLLMDHPNVYNLPAAPRLPSRNIAPGLLASAAAAALLIGGVALAFLGGGRKGDG